jgi:hypothetical protein
MTPAEIDMREERGDAPLSTADSVAVRMAKAAGGQNLPLFAPNDTQDFRSRWEKVQIGFVDEPRTAVAQADELVASAIKRLAEIFDSERQKLETEWDKTDNISTEDLRVALRRYRSFFDRLLSV